LHSRASVSEFQSGGQSIIAATKLDIKNSNNSAKANTNKVLSTTMTLDTITFHPVTASTVTALSTTTALDAITFHPATASIATIMALECVAVCPKMTAVDVRSTAASTADLKASDCITVYPPKAINVSATKTDTKAGPAIETSILILLLYQQNL
jgi:hypothetical protein